MNPWKRARLEHARAEVNRRALDKLTEEWQRLCAQHDATARLLVDAENHIRGLQRQARRPDVTRLRVELAIKGDVIAALEERLAQAQKAQLACDREHGPLVRVRQLVERDAT